MTKKKIGKRNYHGRRDVTLTPIPQRYQYLVISTISHSIYTVKLSLIIILHLFISNRPECSFNKPSVRTTGEVH